jgi:hypothetical protein
LHIYHIYPLNDTFEHEFDLLTCPCRPTVKVETAPWDYRSNIIILHNSFDNREQFKERGTT